MWIAELSRTEMRSHPNDHLDQQLHREQPNEQHLPQPQVARGPSIVGDIRILSEKFLALRENIKAGEKYQQQTKPKEDAQRGRSLFEIMNSAEEVRSHSIVSPVSNAPDGDLTNNLQFHRVPRFVTPGVAPILVPARSDISTHTKIGRVEAQACDDCKSMAVA